MDNTFTIQCPHCGTYYNDLQDVCPYCGEPQPDDSALPPVGYQLELTDTPAPPPPFPGYTPPDYANLNDAPDEAYPPAHPFAQDDIFAVAGQSDPEEYYYPDLPEEGYEDEPYYPDELDENGYPLSPEAYGDDPDYWTHDDAGEAVTPRPRRLTFRRVMGGCLVLVLCAGLFYSGIGLLAIRAGLQERSQLAVAEALSHYQKGQELLAEKSYQFASAEFQEALKLNPNFPEARQALREAQQQERLQPTPTSQTRTAAVTDIFSQAQQLMDAKNWADAIITLTQVRDLDPEFRPEQVADMLYTANFEQGRQLLSPAQITEAQTAFQQALAEKPDDAEATIQYTRASLYQKGQADLAQGDKQAAIRSLKQLYQDEAKYMDIADVLWQTYVDYGDELVDAKEWCLAQAQYQAALDMKSTTTLQGKLDTSDTNCQDDALTKLTQATPTARTGTATAKATPTNGTPTGAANGATATPAAGETPSVPPDNTAPGQGNIVYSAYNPDETRWEILTIPAGGGVPTLLQENGSMPSVSANGQMLVYHSERQDSVGLHVRSLVTGEDIRATIFADHILPRWEGGDTQFVFVAQDKANGRWQIFRGFADGKGDPVILGDGRTPTSSPDGQKLAFQGTDPEGNNPGIYVTPAFGGESTRLTNHESDRSPMFSPDGSKIAYMSTQGGNWDVYVVSSSGGAPKKVTTASGNDGLPAWSPDGSRLAYVSDQSGEWAIWTIAQIGGTPTQIIAWDGVNRPDWLMAQISWSR